MKEYIERAAVKDEILSWAVCINHPELLRKEDTMHCIDNMPSANVAEVVRCRDCKWFNHYTMECESDDVATDHEGGASFSINFGPDDFCSYGQRKETDHEVSE